MIKYVEKTNLKINVFEFMSLFLSKYSFGIQ